LGFVVAESFEGGAAAEGSVAFEVGGGADEDGAADGDVESFCELGDPLAFVDGCAPGAGDDEDEVDES
jgi:hypothetical protein